MLETVKAASLVCVAVAFLASLAVGSNIAACSSGTSTGTSSGSSGSSGSSATVGFDCPALRDKQLTASCPKFDGARYLVDCEATKQQLSGCKAQLDAFANCRLDQPVSCNAAGSVEDATPVACKSLEAALQSCFSDGGNGK